MIKSFRCRETERVFQRQATKRFSADLQRIALRKLLVLDASDTLDDLRVPTGNRLEKLHHGVANQYSIRINDQWRICFRWHNGNAYNVEILDYH